MDGLMDGKTDPFTEMRGRIESHSTDSFVEKHQFSVSYESVMDQLTELNTSNHPFFVYLDCACISAVLYHCYTNLLFFNNNNNNNSSNSKSSSSSKSNNFFRDKF